MLSASLIKLNAELVNYDNQNKKRASTVTKEDMMQIQREDQKYRKRKIPESSNIFS